MTEAEQQKRSSLEKYHLKQRIRELANKRSHIQSTTLVTLYIPPGTRLSDIQQKLNEEAGTAVNIKDKNTGKAVADALRSIMARMQYLKNGDNGLAIFAGITEDAGKVEYFAIDPPEPVGIKDYVCDSRFHTEHLEQMLDDKNQLGVIVIDRGGATFATIRGSYLNILDDRTSFVPGKHGRGGQSAGRIERGIEILAQEWFTKMAAVANHLFLDENEVSAIVVGGPAMSKDQFLDNPNLDYRLKEKVMKVYDVGYTGEAGVRELLSRAGDDLGEYALVRERKLYQQFLKELGEDSGKAIYGEEPIRNAFKSAAVDTLLFSEGIERLHVKIQCSNCEKEFLEASKEVDIPELETKISQTKCPNCKQEGSLDIISKDYLIDEFERLCMETGASLEIIGMGHEDGIQLFKTFGGLAAILRYSLEW